MHLVHTAECPDIGPICETSDEPAQLHDLHFTLGELQLAAAFGLSDRWGLDVLVPVKVVAVGVQYRHLDGTVFEPDYADIHHRQETMAGLGDPELRALGSLDLGKAFLVGKVGSTLPVGRTEENPFELGLAGLEHQHIQLGTGTFQPVLGVDVSLPAAPWGASAYALVHGSFYDNPHGYRAGHRAAFGLAGSRTLWKSSVLVAAADLAREEAERWDGEVETEGNLGRTDLLVGADLLLTFGAVVVSPGFRVPLLQAVEGAQLDMPFIASVGVGRAWRLGPRSESPRSATSDGPAR